MTRPEDFIDKYCAWAEEQTDAPEAFHIGCALSVLAAAIGKNIYYPSHIKRVFPNIYLIIIGKSSVSRKTTAIEMARYLLSHYNKKLILPEVMTPEACFETLADPQQKGEGIFIWSEFSTQLSRFMKEYMSGFKDDLTYLYDSPQEYTRKFIKSGKEIIIKEPCISILGGSTSHWLTKYFQETDLSGGFLVRFLYLPAKRTRSYAFAKPADTHKTEILLRMLIEIATIKGEVRFDKVRKDFGVWHEQNERMIHANPSEDHSSILSRLDTYLKKLCMLLSVSQNRSLVVSPEVFERARALVETFKWDFFRLTQEEFAFTKTSKKIVKIKQLIKDANGGISRGKLLRHSHMSRWELDTVLDTLLQSESIVEEIKKSDTKPATYYRFLA